MRLVIGAVILTVIASLTSSNEKLIKDISALASAPNGTYALEGEAILNKNIVVLVDEVGSIEATCSNLNKGCAGAGLIKVKKQGSSYSVLDLIKRPTRNSLNKIEDVEVVHDSLIRILIKGQWLEVHLNKSNVNAARDLVLNKNLNGWVWDSNTLSLIKVGAS